MVTPPTSPSRPGAPTSTGTTTTEPQPLPAPVTAKDRGYAKSSVTKAQGAMKRHIIEGDTDAVTKQLSKIKSVFNVFESIHDSYHGNLDNLKDIELSEVYFATAETAYIEVIKLAKDFLSGKSAQSAQSVAPPISNIEKLCEYMSMPDTPIMTFYGDPLLYNEFMITFDERVHAKSFDDSFKLSRLMHFTGGDARSSIKHCALVGGTGYQKARDILKVRFGDSHLIAHRVVDNLKKGKIVSTPSELQQLANDLCTASATLKEIGKFSELQNQRSILDILQRVPHYIKSKWQKKALLTKKDSGNYPDFDAFVDFMQRISTESLDPVYGSDSMRSANPKSNARGALSNYVASDSDFEAYGNYGASDNVHEADGGAHSADKPSCILCNADHTLFQCDQFKAMRPQARLDYARSKRLCFLCLQSGHGSPSCRKQYSCTVCNNRHTKFLHVDYRPAYDNRNGTADDRLNQQSNGSAGYADRGFNANANATNVILPIVPVRINGQPQTYYCLLDQGSTNTFIERSVVDSLNMRKRSVDWTISTLSNDSRVTEMVDFKLHSVDNDGTVEMSNVLVVPHLSARHPDKGIDMSAYPHLADLPLNPDQSNMKVNIIIGLDNAHLLVPYETRTDPNGGNKPFATRTFFGWAIGGPVEGISMQIMSHHVMAGNLDMHVENSLNTKEIVVNDAQKASEIDAERKAPEIKESTSDLLSKTLEVRYDVRPDEFMYIDRPVADDRTLTKRVVLAQLSPTYEPLGLIPPFILKGRIIFQDISRLTLDWDEPIPPDKVNKWYRWTDSLKDIDPMRLEQRLLPADFVDGAVEMIYCADASLRSYGEGSNLCVKATRLDTLLRAEMDIQFIRSSFITDNQIVLSYIHSEANRFPTLAANRVAEIRRQSEPDQCFHVAGTLNPADVLSRCCNAKAMPRIRFEDLDFLPDYRNDWPGVQSASAADD